ncbi:hypothetical protein [Nocardia sp. NPDC050793]|uniref:hypothetical protein n=1 Tax=Nocardia sp. NPDC050793 TaxID=3155159 RepID=UPI0033ED110E
MVDIDDPDRVRAAAATFEEAVTTAIWQAVETVRKLSISGGSPQSQLERELASVLRAGLTTVEVAAQGHQSGVAATALGVRAAVDALVAADSAAAASIQLQQSI